MQKERRGFEAWILPSFLLSQYYTFPRHASLYALYLQIQSKRVLPPQSADEETRKKIGSVTTLTFSQPEFSKK